MEMETKEMVTTISLTQEEKNVLFKHLTWTFRETVDTISDVLGIEGHENEILEMNRELMVLRRIIEILK